MIYKTLHIKLKMEQHKSHKSREGDVRCVDVKGNLYVVGQHTSNIVIISADGQYQKQILTNEDGLNSPSAVCFDEPKKQLLEGRHFLLKSVSILL
jgi:sugar lactone lactonase YvrE